MELTYTGVIGVARLLFRAWGLKIEVTGDERVPLSGPVILASNHVSFLDFLLVGLVGRRGGRHVRFLARHDLWRPPGVGRALDAMRHVPVDRAAPAGAYLQARSLLREGEAVGIFPEAGISTSYTVRAMMPGAVALARETGAPLLPVAIWGSQRVLTAKRPVDLTRGRPVTVVVGEPVHVAADADVPDRTRWLAGRLQDQLDQLQARPEHQPRPGDAAPWHPAHLGGQAPAPQDAVLAESVPGSAIAPDRRFVWVDPAAEPR